MYNAPAVSYPVGRSHFQAFLTLAVVVAGAVAQTTWWLLSAEHGAGHVLGGVLWLAISGWAVWYGLHTHQAQLVWDGQGWMWRSGTASQVVVPQVILDGQYNLLLCLQPQSGAAWWVWPAQQAQPERWLALRRALFNPSFHPVEPDPSRLTASSEA